MRSIFRYFRLIRQAARLKLRLQLPLHTHQIQLQKAARPNLQLHRDLQGGQREKEVDPRVRTVRAVAPLSKACIIMERASTRVLSQVICWPHTYALHISLGSFYKWFVGNYISTNIQKVLYSLWRSISCHIQEGVVAFYRMRIYGKCKSQ